MTETTKKDPGVEVRRILRTIQEFGNLSESDLCEAVWHRCNEIGTRVRDLAPHGNPQWHFENGIEHAARDIVTLVNAYESIEGSDSRGKSRILTISTLDTAYLDTLLMAECEWISSAEEEWTESQYSGAEFTLGDVKDSAIRIVMLRQAYTLSNSRQAYPES